MRADRAMQRRSLVDEGKIDAVTTCHMLSDRWHAGASNLRDARLQCCGGGAERTDDEVGARLVIEHGLEVGYGEWQRHVRQKRNTECHRGVFVVRLDKLHLSRCYGRAAVKYGTSLAVQGGGKCSEVECECGLDGLAPPRIAHRLTSTGLRHFPLNGYVMAK